ncbi:MAG: hypothetical protein AAGF56_15720, partial [Pseudomonadota bacterium]
MIATLIAGSLMVPLPATTADAPAPTRGAVTLAQRSHLEVAERFVYGALQLVGRLGPASAAIGI